MKNRVIPKPNDKFGRLTVIELSHKDHNYRRFWKCICDCGVEKTVQGSLLTSGNTKSCGCLVDEVRRKPKTEGYDWAINQIILRYKRHANRRKLKWFLTKEQVKKLISKPCYYCGESSSNTFKNSHHMDGFKYNGIDRINSSKSYSSDNVVPCCSMCNRAKSDISKEEFIEWAKKIAYQWA